MAAGQAGQFDERAFVTRLLAKVVEECPRRQATSHDERRAQEILRREFEKLGFGGTFEKFRFNDNLYANLALHFGLGTAGTVLSPAAPGLAFILHLLAGTSYYLDSVHRTYVLRRLLPFKHSQNLLVSLPATGEPDLRIVMPAHVDAAFTGLMFDPRLVRLLSPRKLPPGLSFLGKGLAAGTYSQFLLAGMDLMRIQMGPLTWPLLPLEWIVALPALVAFVLNAEVVRRNEIVPGANDDLSGVVGLALLARRLAPVKPDNVELVFVVTGSEEASLGGSQALARSRSEAWDRDRTVVIGLDSLSCGELRYFEEGEVRRVPIAPWLLDVLDEVSSSEHRFSKVTRFHIHMGATDVLAFQTRGFDGVCLGCVDPDLDAPRHYHLPSDTPENVDPDDVVLAVDYAERLVRTIVRRRLGVTMPGA